MEHSASIEGLVSEAAGKNVLKEENIEPRDLIEEILNEDYEISTFFGCEKVNTKINTEIRLIEEELTREIAKTKSILKEFTEMLKKYMPKLQLETETMAKAEEEIHKLDLLMLLIYKIESLYLSCKEYSKSLAPILRTGGYRSLCICLIESLKRISIPLTDPEQYANTSFIK